jgi:hypothetical protein
MPAADSRPKGMRRGFLDSGSERTLRHAQVPVSADVHAIDVIFKWRTTKSIHSTSRTPLGRLRVTLRASLRIESLRMTTRDFASISVGSFHQDDGSQRENRSLRHHGLPGWVKPDRGEPMALADRSPLNRWLS